MVLIFTVSCKKVKPSLTEKEPLMTSGSVNAFICTFDFSEEWDGLNKFAVFKTSQVEPIRVFLGDKTSCFVPWEMFISAGETIRVGAYGMHGMPEDEDSYIVMPTTWLTLGVVDEGVIFGKEPEDPTPDILEQILETKGDTLDYRENTLYLKAGDKVLSSVEIVGGGGSTPGADGKDGTTFIPHISDDGTLTWTNDGNLPNPDPVNLMGPEGQDGEDGKEYLVINTSFYNPPQVGVIYSLDLSDFNRMPTMGEKTSGVITVDSVAYYVTGIIPSINIIDGVSHPDVKITKATKLTGDPGTGVDLDFGDGLEKDGNSVVVQNPNRGIMSLSEFNALTDKEKLNGTYFVDDGAIGGNWEVYSEEEKVVGTYLKKPLYRRVVHFTTPSRYSSMTEIVWNDTGLSIQDVDVLVTSSLSLSSSDDYKFADQSTNDVCIHNGKILCCIRGYGTLCNRPAMAILEYTKTTDPEVTT